MANIIRGKNPSTPTQAETADLGKTEFGAKTALAAIQTRPEPRALQRTPAALPPQERVRTKPLGRVRSNQPRRGHEKSFVELREEATRKLIARGSITGAAALRARSQARTRAVSANVSVGSEVEDAWQDPNEVSRTDDISSALEKRAARAQEAESRIDSQIDGPDPDVNLGQAEGLNSVSQPIRDFANYGTLENNPEMLTLLAGLSESFDAYLQKNGMEVQDPNGLTDDQLQQLFAMMNRKKKTLSEDEEEAELILTGVIAILALPKIEERLEELGLSPAEAQSLKGTLKKLLDKVKQDDSPYNHLYQMLQEEADLSIIPEETEGTGI